MGHPNKMNGSAPSLDQRIAAVLATAEVNKDVLVALLHEAEQVLVNSQATITTESANALDLANPDPDASDELVRKAQRTIARLNIAIPKLSGRIRAVELHEYRTAWHTEADVVQARGSKAAERLTHYQKFVTWLKAEFEEIDDINSEIHALHARAPEGEDRRLLEPELMARGIDHYDAVHPRLREQLKLPDFVRASEVAYPPNPMDQWNRHAAQANEALAQRMKDKYGLAYSPDWASARDLAVEQEEREFRKQADELRAKEVADKAAYDQGLKQQGR